MSLSVLTRAHQIVRRDRQEKNPFEPVQSGVPAEQLNRALSNFRSGKKHDIFVSKVIRLKESNEGNVEYLLSPCNTWQRLATQLLNVHPTVANILTYILTQFDRLFRHTT